MYDIYECDLEHDTKVKMATVLYLKSVKLLCEMLNNDSSARFTYIYEKTED